MTIKFENMDDTKLRRTKLKILQEIADKYNIETTKEFNGKTINRISRTLLCKKSFSTRDISTSL